MKSKLIKSLSLCMACLALTLLLNVVTQKNNLKTGAPTKVATILRTNQDPPW